MCLKTLAPLERRYEIEPIIAGKMRIVETNGVHIFRQWLYSNRELAMIEFSLWAKRKFQGEPENYSARNITIEAA